jgi:hypothetical protein
MDMVLTRTALSAPSTAYATASVGAFGAGAQYAARRHASQQASDGDERDPSYLRPLTGNGPIYVSREMELALMRMSGCAHPGYAGDPDLHDSGSPLAEQQGCPPRLKLIEIGIRLPATQARYMPLRQSILIRIPWPAGIAVASIKQKRLIRQKHLLPITAIDYHRWANSYPRLHLRNLLKCFLKR